MTRVSTRKSAAMAHAEPMAMPTSVVLIAHGTAPGFPSHVEKPQYAQFNPCTCYAQFNPCTCCLVPISNKASPCRIFSASRIKKCIPVSSLNCNIISEMDLIVSPVAMAISMISIPFPLGAVRAAVAIALAVANTRSALFSRSFPLFFCHAKVVFFSH